MADPKDTTGGRDYGRRMYISKRSYPEQKRLASDFHANKWRKHSEYKQPYYPDITYPEMEGYDFPPWNPVWPKLPDTPVTVDPIDPGGPIFPHEYDPDDPNRDFLGCFFRQPLTPSIARPGQTVYARLAMRDDPVIRIEIHGPATLLSGSNALCTNRGQQAISSGPNGRKPYANVPECTVIIRINNDVSGYEANPSTGELLVVVIAHTASGSSCSTDVAVATCTDESIAPEFDLDSTPETIGGTAEVAVFLEPNTGTPPFTWAITGTGFSIPVSKTTARMAFVKTTNACGTGSITVVDACGLSDYYEIRSTENGQWVSHMELFTNQIPGLPTRIDPYVLGVCAYPTHERLVGGQRVRHCHVISGGGSGCPNTHTCAECPGGCGYVNCDPDWACADVIDISPSYPCVLSNRCVVDNFGDCSTCTGGEYHSVWCMCNGPVDFYVWECS